MSNTENTKQFKVGDRIKCVEERLGFPVGFETTVLEDEWILDIDGDRRPIFERYFELVIPTRTALEQRMEDLVRAMAKGEGVFPSLSSMDHYAEARAILAELEPVDGDLLEARELYAQRYETFGDYPNAKDARDGKWDNVDGYIPWLVKAIKRGRALERGE